MIQIESTDVAVSSLYLLPYGFSSSGSHLKPFESPPRPSLLDSIKSNKIMLCWQKISALSESKSAVSLIHKGGILGEGGIALFQCSNFK